MSSFGEELRRERELRQITLREVAESTKISLRYLEALENNEFDNLPGGVFNRGFVRAYAEYIGIDPDSTVTSYLMEEQTRLADRAAAYGRDGVLRRGAPQAVDMPQKVAVLGRGGWLMVAGVLAIVLITLAVVVAWNWLGRVEDPETGVAPTETSAGVRTDERSAALPTMPETGTVDAGEQDNAAAEPGENRPVEPARTAAPDPAAVVAPTQPSAAPSDALLTRVRVLRPTSGRVNCDNTRIEILDGLRAGTSIEFLCRRYLTVDAEDGGAVEIGLGDETAQSLGADGERIVGRRIDVAQRRAAGSRP